MLSKKKLKEINRISVVTEVIVKYEGRDIGGIHWLDTPPEMWMPEETKLFDLMHDVEMKIKEKIFEAIGQQP